MDVLLGRDSSTYFVQAHATTLKCLYVVASKPKRHMAYK
jgi:hypothetical protein